MQQSPRNRTGLIMAILVIAGLAAGVGLGLLLGWVVLPVTYVDTKICDLAPELCRSSSVLGNGKLSHIHDLVAVDHRRFVRAKTRDVATEVARMNAELLSQGVPYALIGLGRWGSADPWLGIPVTWDQISGARVIVEAGFEDLHVTPSQGSHFFQNLTSFRVGYFTVNPEAGEGFLDWEWLDEHLGEPEEGFVRHLHFEDPLVVKINGKKQQGVILKPGHDGSNGRR